MSVWSSIAKSLSKFFKGGSAAAGAAGAAGAAPQVVTKVLTWGNAAKVAVVGAFTYLFLSGGASNVVAKTLGVPEPVAQVLIVFIFLVLLMFVIRYLVNYAREKLGDRSRYLDEPVFVREGRGRSGEQPRYWDFDDAYPYGQDDRMYDAPRYPEDRDPYRGRGGML